MKRALVSIVVPIYNCAFILDKTIKKILAQTYSPLEIILVNDGSTDASGDICNLYAEKYGNVLAFHQVHKGVSAARNLGIDRAKGKYIQFTDADDELMPEMIERMVAVIEEYQVDMVCCGYEIIKDNGAIQKCFGTTPCVLHKDVWTELDTILRNDYLSVTWNKLYIREKIKHMYDEKVLLCEDSIFATHYFIDNISLAVCPHILYRYNQKSGKQSKKNERIFGYQGIKKYFYYNWKLAQRIPTRMQRINCYQHIYKVYFYGIYTYIFEQAIKNECAYEDTVRVIESVLQDSLYQKIIRRIKMPNMKERIYIFVSVIKSPCVLILFLNIR